MRGLALISAIGLSIFAFTSNPFGQTGSVIVQTGDNSKQGQDEDGCKQHEGPPSYAPAHEYRAKHQYRYYPCCNVYSEPSRKVFFYIKSDEWIIGASLPTNLRRSLSGYVNMSLDTDKPYEYHDEHVQLYPNYRFPPYRGAKRQ
jgi:hypothetical protein